MMLCQKEGDCSARSSNTLMSSRAFSNFAGIANEKERERERERERKRERMYV